MNNGLLGLAELNKKDIEKFLTTAISMKKIFTRSIKKVPILRGKTVVNLFYEPSTRTRTSFEIAAKRLSADVINISTSNSSVTKGESLIDTLKTIEAMNVDIIVIRHHASGVPHFLSKYTNIPIINAGDGIHEHPSQGLLDLFTIKEKKGFLKNLKITIIGDILHSRVSRSNIIGLNKMGAKIRIVAPTTLIPMNIDKMGCKIYSNIEKALLGVDIIYCLRIQFERQNQKYLPSINEYIDLYGLNKKRIRLAKKNVLIMHPGPISQGIELFTDIAYSSQSIIQEQVTNGIAIRMAIFFHLLKDKINEKKTTH